MLNFVLSVSQPFEFPLLKILSLGLYPIFKLDYSFLFLFVCLVFCFLSSLYFLDITLQLHGCWSKSFPTL